MHSHALDGELAPSVKGPTTVESWAKSAQSQGAYRYLNRVAAAAALTFVTAVIMDGIVDAKGLYGTLRIGGFNSAKAFQYNYTPEVKALAVRSFRPEIVFFGASTVERGIVPQCRSSPTFGKPRIYNEAASGNGPPDFLAAYPNLRTIGTVRRIEIEARFANQQFLPAAADTLNRAAIDDPRRRPPPSIPREDDILSRTIQPWLPPQFASTYLADFFTWKTAVLNFQTVAANRKTDQLSVFNGYGKDGTFDQAWLTHMAARAIVEELALAHVGFLTETFLAKISSDMGIDFSYVDALAAAAARDRVALDFFVPPEHVVQLLLYDQGGVWPLYEKFKFGLLRSVDAAKQRYGADIRVFDFGTLNDATKQPLRSAIPKESFDPYYSDPVHFRKIVGDFMLASMLGCIATLPAPGDFGTELRGETISVHLAAERAKLDSYRRSNMEIVGKISEQIAQHRHGVH
jgi:hypothetical protein